MDVKALYYFKEASSIHQAFNNPPVFTYKANRIPLIAYIYNLVMALRQFYGQVFLNFQ